ncbi:MAG: 1-acyl-sn-glycerol-3-phosphate acyltransferase [Clostridia bacterium]|nr:1-acyl-sn-glycerol-3-phosphate acyltransferase [Clostridia bacterium]
MNKLVVFFKIILYPIYRTLFWYSIEGLENLPKSGGYIFCSNHISAIDAVLWILKFPARIHFMAKAELFKIPILRGLFYKVDVFPVDRGSGDMQSINKAIDIVKSGDVLGIFPEGTRSKDGKPGRPKSGAAYISNLAEGAPVVPAAVVCKDGKLRPFKKIKLIIGKPIPYSEIKFQEGDRKNLRRVSTLIMDHITGLWEKGQNEL